MPKKHLLSTIKKMNNLQFDFTVDKLTNSVFITREFDAELPLVWMLLLNQKFLTNGGHLNL